MNDDVRHINIGLGGAKVTEKNRVASLSHKAKCVDYDGEPYVSEKDMRKMLADAADVSWEYGRKYGESKGILKGVLYSVAWVMLGCLIWRVALMLLGG